MKSNRLANAFSFFLTVSMPNDINTLLFQFLPITPEMYDVSEKGAFVI